MSSNTPALANQSNHRAFLASPSSVPSNNRAPAPPLCTFGPIQNRKRRSARSVLAFDPDNADALDLITASHRALPNQETVPSPQSPSTFVTSIDQPSSFANGRYQVTKFLGEGGKKRVYLAQDTLLDRQVAFALIKTEGLDEVSRTRITREAQAMGRLGSHPMALPVI